MLAPSFACNCRSAFELATWKNSFLLLARYFDSIYKQLTKIISHVFFF